MIRSLPGSISSISMIKKKKLEKIENSSSMDLHRDFGHQLFPQARILSSLMKSNKNQCCELCILKANFQCTKVHDTSSNWNDYESQSGKFSPHALIPHSFSNHSSKCAWVSTAQHNNTLLLLFQHVWIPQIQLLKNLVCYFTFICISAQ